MANRVQYIPKEELIIFSRQLALVIESEVSLVEGLTLIQDKADHKLLQSSIGDVIKDIQVGESIGSALKKKESVFSPFFVNMIHIGEESGDMATILNQIADTYEKEEETTKKVRSAVTYPIILTVLMLGVVVLLIVQILPMFNDILTSLGGTMPAFTKGMMEIGLFVGKYIYIILIVIVLIIMVGFLMRSNEGGRYALDRNKLRVPIQKGIIGSLSAVRFSRNLGLLINSGLNISIALDMVKPVMNNLYIEQQIDEVKKDINEGKAIGDALERLNLFPWVLIKLFAIAQNTGHMDQVLFRAADVMEKDLDNRLNKLTTVIEPALIIILSIIVGVILLSVILPIVDIMNAIG